MSTLYTLQHTSQLMQATHGPIRKFFLLFQMGFYAIVTVLTWTNVANLFLTLLLIFGQAIQRSGLPKIEAQVAFGAIYAALILLQVMLGIAGKLTSSYNLYQGLAGFFIFMMIFSFCIGIWLLSTNGKRTTSITA